MIIFYRRVSLNLIRFIFFFIIFYLYILLRIDPRLMYHGNGIIDFPVFYRGMEFFERFTAYPGGLTDYVSAFLSQYYYFHYPGSFIITIITILISIETYIFIKSVGITRFSSIIYVPAILILMIHNQYVNCMAISIGLLVSLFFYWIYTLTAKNGTIFRSSIFLVFSVLLYYSIGGAYLLFAVLCLFYELFYKRKFVLSFLYFLTALLFPYFTGIYIFEINITDTYLNILPFHPESYSVSSGAAWFLYIFFPVSAFWSPTWRFIAGTFNLHLPGDKSSQYETKKTLSNKNIADNDKRGNLKILYESIVIFVIAAVLALFSFQNKKNTALRINYLYCNEMWEEIVDEALRISPENYYLVINHDVNRALYHTDRLLYDMFSYPQRRESLFLLSFLSTKDSFPKADLPRLSDTLLMLGLVNNAEHAAYEAYVLINDYPAILRQLYFINIVKGYTEAAHVFLTALSKDLIWGNWSKRQQQYIEKNPSMDTDKVVSQIRSVRQTTDYVGDYSIEKVFESLLHFNKNNRMAFEYLIAYYLLTHQLDKIVQFIPMLDNFNYSEIPRHFEEALMLYMSTRSDEVDLRDRKISHETFQNYHRFSTVLARYRNNPQAAKNMLARQFGDSYYFYVAFGFSGLKK